MRTRPVRLDNACAARVLIYVILCSKRVGEIYSHTRTSDSRIDEKRNLTTLKSRINSTVLHRYICITCALRFSLPSSFSLLPSPFSLLLFPFGFKTISFYIFWIYYELLRGNFLIMSNIYIYTHNISEIFVV